MAPLDTIGERCERLEIMSSATTNEGVTVGHDWGHSLPHYQHLIISVLSDVDTNAGTVKPETGTGDTVTVASRETGQSGYSDQYWTPQYGLTAPHYHTAVQEQLQEGEEDSGDHYRDSAGPIRGYPGARSDAFVWRPY